MEQNQSAEIILASLNMILKTRPIDLRKEPIWNRVGSGYESGFRITRGNKTEFVILTQYDSQDKADYSYIEMDGKKYTCDFDTRYTIYDKLHSIKEKENNISKQNNGITR